MAPYAGGGVVVSRSWFGSGSQGGSSYDVTVTDGGFQAVGGLRFKTQGVLQPFVEVRLEVMLPNTSPVRDSWQIMLSGGVFFGQR